jgi:hypothetical protein
MNLQVEVAFEVIDGLVRVPSDVHGKEKVYGSIP